MALPLIRAHADAYAAVFTLFRFMCVTLRAVLDIIYYLRMPLPRMLRFTRFRRDYFRHLSPPAATTFSYRYRRRHAAPRRNARFRHYRFTLFFAPRFHAVVDA